MRSLLWIMFGMLLMSQSSYAQTTQEDRQVTDEIPKIETRSIRPRDRNLELDVYRLPPSQLRRLEEESDKSPRKIFPLETKRSKLKTTNKHSR